MTKSDWWKPGLIGNIYCEKQNQRASFGFISWEKFCVHFIQTFIVLQTSHSLKNEKIFTSFQESDHLLKTTKDDTSRPVKHHCHPLMETQLPPQLPPKLFIPSPGFILSRT